MSTLSIPINSQLADFIDQMIASGQGASKADVVRRALREYSENIALNRIRKAQQEIIDDQGVTGDLETIIKQMTS